MDADDDNIEEVESHQQDAPEVNVEEEEEEEEGFAAIVGDELDVAAADTEDDSSLDSGIILIDHNIQAVFRSLEHKIISGERSPEPLDLTHTLLNSIQGTSEGPFLRKCREVSKLVDYVRIELDLPWEEEPDSENLIEEHWRFRRFIGRCLGLFDNLKHVEVGGTDMLGAAIILENVSGITELQYIRTATQEEHELSAGMYSLELALKGLSKLKKLEVIVMDGARMHGLFSVFFKVIPRMRHLKSLILWRYEYEEPDGLRSVFGRSNSLEEIDFMHCSFNSLDNCALADALAYNPRLKILKQHLCDTDVDSSMLVSQALVTNTTLVELKIDACPADSRFYRALVLALRKNCTLKTLELGNMVNIVDLYEDDETEPAHTRDERADAIHSAGLRDLLLVALRSNSSLQKIALQNFFLDEFLLGAMHSYLAAETTSLTILDMMAYGPTPWDNRVCNQMFYSVGQNKSLTFFSVSGEIKLGAKEIGVAVLSLQDNRTLEELYMCPRRLFEDGGSELFVECIKNLEKNRGVKRLQVVGTAYYPSFTVQQWGAILDVLKHNYTISDCPQIEKPLSLNDGGDNNEGENDNDSHVIKDISFLVAIYLKLNKHGRAYLLESNPSKEQGVHLIEAVSDDLDAIYLSILENPLLCARSPANHNHFRVVVNNKGPDDDDDDNGSMSSGPSSNKRRRRL